MTGPSKTLSRLGVGVVSAATLVSGMIALAPAASAAPTSLTISPGTQTGAAGTCLAYTVTAGGTTAERSGQSVTVRATPTGANAATTDVDFCSAGAATNGSGGSNGGDNAADTSTFTTDSDGTFTFGVVSTDQSSSASLQAFVDTNSNGSPDAGELTSTSATANWTTGGAPGSNAAADAVSTVTVSPSSDNAAPGETRTYTAQLNNADATPHGVPGVTPLVQVEHPSGTVVSGPTACTQSDNTGSSTCTVTLPANAAGGDTDIVRVFVNQSGAGTTPGFDASEPNDTSSVSIFSAPTGDSISTTCSGTTTGSSCTVAASDAGGITFTAHVKDSTGADASGVQVSFSVSGTSSGGATTNVTPAECQTAADGTCSITVTPTQANRTPGGKITVTSRIRGTSTSSSATATFTNTSADARNVTLTPVHQTETPGGVASVTATALDSTGAPVAGVFVEFTESGPGRFASGGGSTNFATTGPDGTVSVDLTSVSSEQGDETVTADITGENQCAAAAGTGTAPNGSTVPSSQSAGNCTASATISIAAPTPPPGKVQERPTMSVHVRGKHSRHFHATTHPKLKGVSVHFYKVSASGHHHYIGKGTTGHAGGAGVTVHLKKGHYRIDCRVVHLGSGYKSFYSGIHHVTVK